MRKLVWQNSLGDSIDLTKAPFGITNWEGFSNAPLNIQSQQVPMQDGSVFLDALIENRDLNVILSIQDGNDLEKRYELERQLIKILNPKLGEGYLIYTNDFISKRIKCIPQIPLFPNKNSNDPGTQKGELSWTACEPYWEDLEEKEITIKDGEVISVENKGDIKNHIKIDIYGNNLNPTIINQTTHKLITISDEYNEPIQINTEVGNKYVSKLNLFFNWLTGSLFSCCYVDSTKTFFAGAMLCIRNKLGDVVVANKPANAGAIIKIIKVGNGRYIALSFSTTLKSDDGGYNWEVLTNRSFSDMIYNNGLCVGVSGYAYIYTSEDNGDTWSSHPTYHSGTNFNMNTVCYCNGFYLAFGNRSNIMKSLDGLSWEDVSSLFPTTSYLNHSAYGNNIIIVIGHDTNVVAKSIDGGASWSAFTIEHRFDCVFYDDEKKSFFLVGNNYAYILSEEDNYQNIKRIHSGNEQLNAICCYKNAYYAVGDGVVLTSQNGLTWEYFIRSAPTLKNVLNYNNILTGVSSDGYVYKSYDGLNWQSVYFLSSYGKKIIHSKKYYFILGVREVYRSIDGENYTEVYSSSIELEDISCGNIQNEEIIVVVGQNGFIMKSNNEGDNWVLSPVELSSIITCVIFVNKSKIGSYFYASCLSGEIIKSNDGYFWTNISQNFVRYVKEFAYINDFFIGYGNDNEGHQCIIKSEDCIRWQITQTGGIFDFVKVINNQVFIGNDITGLLASYNGIDWENYGLIGVSVNGVFNIKNKYIAFCQHGGLFNSEFIKNDNLISKLSVDSDINLVLDVGENVMTFKSDKVDSDYGFAILKYRQKYIGV